ncbi:hypothetical protein HY450_00685 [Candidatus Pacearchaeota archaeon]|nr:hypothetical protein [Candidatus Pacearchaeota archaeon]
MNYLKRFWKFLNEDTWYSWVVFMILLIVVIRFVFFPLLSFATGSSLPLVVIESCSMYHESNFESWWEKNFEWYESKSIREEEFEKFPFKNGLNKGDIVFVWGRSDIKIGDVIIFEPNSDATAKNPIIHRVVSLEPLGTKGDHNERQLEKNNNANKIDETSIREDDLIGKSVFRVPAAGWIKLVFFEPFRAKSQRGLCK